MADYGVKISKPGVDVLTAGLKDLYFHSAYPFLKIKSSGSGSLTFTDGGAGFDVTLTTHSLGYQPFAQVFSQAYDPFLNTLITSYRRMPLTERSAGGLIRQNYNPIASTTTLRYTGATTGGDGASHTISYYWVVYYDPQ